MDLELQNITKIIDDNSVQCLQEIIEEHNPFTFLELQDASADAIRKWIREQYQIQYIHKDSHMLWICVEKRVIGLATIKKTLSQELFAESGHVGLCIAKQYRRHGFGEQALKCLLKEVRRRYALNDILLCCHYDNIASRRLCEKIGGIKKHEDSFVHYWISEHMEDVCDI